MKNKKYEWDAMDDHYFLKQNVKNVSSVMLKKQHVQTVRTTHRFVKSNKINGISIQRVLILIRYTVPNTVFFYFY